MARYEASGDFDNDFDGGYDGGMGAGYWEDPVFPIDLRGFTASPAEYEVADKVLAEIIERRNTNNSVTKPETPTYSVRACISGAMRQMHNTIIGLARRQQPRR